MATTESGARKAKRKTQADAKSMTQSALRERLHYDPETGVFTWIKAPKHILGKEAGSVKTGERGRGTGRYRIINIGGVLYRAHRLAWLYMTGSWPIGDVDHVNRQRSDNRWDNLRAATRAENNANRRESIAPASGVKGVLFDARYHEPWKAQASVDGKTVVLGRFATKELAAQAYADHTRRRFGDFARIDGHEAKPRRHSDADAHTTASGIYFGVRSQ